MTCLISRAVCTTHDHRYALHPSGLQGSMQRSIAHPIPQLLRSVRPCAYGSIPTEAAAAVQPTIRRQTVDYTLLAASVHELQAWMPAKIEQVHFVASADRTEHAPLLLRCAQGDHLICRHYSHNTQVVQFDRSAIALRLRTLQDSTYLHMSWDPSAARIHLGSPPPRGATSEAYSFGTCPERRSIAA